MLSWIDPGGCAYDQIGASLFSSICPCDPDYPAPNVEVPQRPCSPRQFLRSGDDPIQSTGESSEINHPARVLSEGAQPAAHGEGRPISLLARPVQDVQK